MHDHCEMLSLWFHRLVVANVEGNVQEVMRYGELLRENGVEVKLRDSCVGQTVRYYYPLVSIMVLAKALEKDEATIRSWWRRRWIPGLSIGEKHRVLWFNIDEVLRVLHERFGNDWRGWVKPRVKRGKREYGVGREDPNPPVAKKTQAKLPVEERGVIESG